MSRVRGVQRHGEGSAGDAAEGSAGVGADRGAVVAETPAGLWRGAVSTQDVHPGLGGGAAAGRVTERLRQRVAKAIASSNRAVSDVAGEYGVSWPTAHKALVVAAARWLPEPAPTSRLGIDETRFRSVRWILGRDHLEAVRSVADQLRRLLPGRAGIAAGVGSWPHRSLCAGVAGRAVRGVPEADRDRGDRPVGAVRLRDPRRPAGRQDRGRQVASGRAGQPDGHRGPATRHPRPARPPRHRSPTRSG